MIGEEDLFKRESYNGIEITVDYFGYYWADEICDKGGEEKSFKNWIAREESMKIIDFISTKNGIKSLDDEFDYTDKTADPPLIFERKSGKYKGWWVSQELIGYIAYWSDISYMIKLQKLANLLNKENLANKITFEEKIVELETRLKDVNSGFNNSLPGSIIIKRYLNGYKAFYKEIDIFDDRSEYLLVIHRVFNIKQIERLAMFYIGGGYVEDIDPSNTVNCFKTSNLNYFAEFIKSLQNFTFRPNYDLDEELDKLIKRRRLNTRLITGTIFEYYCAMVFELTPYNLETTESIGLRKNDIGVDLISIEKKTIAQCKFYDSTPLKYNSIRGFLNFCNTFEDWRKILIILDTTILENKIEMIKEIEIFRISIDEVEEFIKERIEYISEEDEVEEETTEEINQQIRNLVSRAIDENGGYIYLADALKMVSSKFFEVSSISLGRICSGLYEIDENASVIPTDLSGRKVLRRPILLSEYYQYISEVVGTKEVEEKELLEMINSRFHTSMSMKMFTISIVQKLDSKIKVQMRRQLQKSINGNYVTVLSDKTIEEFISYFKSQRFNGMQELTREFNNQFDRYETHRTLGYLSLEIGVKDPLSLYDKYEIKKIDDNDEYTDIEYENPPSIDELRSYMERKLKMAKKGYLKLTELIEAINKRFHMNFTINNIASTFKGIYKIRRQTDENGNRLITYANPNVEIDEEEFIRKTIGDKEYIRDAYIELHNQTFKTVYTKASFSRKFSHLFVMIGSNPMKQSLFKRKIGKYYVQLLILKDRENESTEIVPDPNEWIKSHKI